MVEVLQTVLEAQDVAAGRGALWWDKQKSLLWGTPGEGMLLGRRGMLILPRSLVCVGVGVCWSSKAWQMAGFVGHRGTQ